MNTEVAVMRRGRVVTLKTTGAGEGLRKEVGISIKSVYHHVQLRNNTMICTQYEMNTIIYYTHDIRIWMQFLYSIFL